MNFSTPPTVALPEKTIQEYLEEKRQISAQISALSIREMNSRQSIECALHESATKKSRNDAFDEKLRNLGLSTSIQEINLRQSMGCALRESETIKLRKHAFDEKLRSVGLSTGQLQDIICLVTPRMGESRASVLRNVVLWHVGIPVESEHKLHLLSELIPFKPISRTANVIVKLDDCISRCLDIETCSFKLWRVGGDDWYNTISASVTADSLAIHRVRRELAQSCLSSMPDKMLIHHDIMDLLLKKEYRNTQSLCLEQQLKYQQQADNQQRRYSMNNSNNNNIQGQCQSHDNNFINNLLRSNRCENNRRNERLSNGQGQSQSHDNNNVINIFLRSNRRKNNSNNNTRNERPSNEAMLQNFILGDIFGSLATTVTTTTNNPVGNNNNRITPAAAAAGTNNDPRSVMQQHCMPYRQYRS